MAKQAPTSAEALPLPKGGGSTRGLGDAFTPDLNRGTGGYGIEIVVPKGLRTLTPSLSLAYNSAGGDGPFGLGWGMAVPVIQRNTDCGTGKTEFLFEGETLVDVGGGFYRQQVENAFYRIRRVGDGWEVTDKTGGVTILGDTPASRIGDFAWLASGVSDTSGNQLRYEYLADGANRYLKAIRYAAFEVVLDYEDRPDKTVSRRAGFAVTQAWRVKTIEVRRPAAAHPLIRRYTLGYQADALGPSLLSQVEMEGFKLQPDGTMLRTLAPVTTFTYTAFDPAARTFLPVQFEAASMPPALDGESTELIDLNGDGLPDILRRGAGRARIWRNRGAGRFSPGTVTADIPQPAVVGSTLLLDADGTGSADLMALDFGLARYYPNDGTGSFGRPRFFGGNRPLSFDASHPDTRVADLDGDGRVDLLKSSAHGMVVWRNLGGTKGFARPVLTSAPQVRFSQRGVRIADMTGDGLPDLVRITDGLVEYWPSLGDGQYDQRQVMANAPRLPRHYDEERLHLADVDGLGAADVVYVDHHRVLIWRNLGGFGFAPPIVVEGTPSCAAEAIRVADLMGTATAGVLWSDVAVGHGSRYRFLSFAGTKPFVLNTIDEGTGTRTVIEYGSSGTHAARAEQDATPWVTNLPIPVPVVDRISRVDLVTGATDTSEIRYYDGRWDGISRRFRGFARVVVRRDGAAEEYRYHVGSSTNDIAQRGQMYLASFYSADLGSPLLRTEATTWAVRQIQPGIVCNEVTSTQVRTIEGGTHPRVVTTSYTYDDVGNVLTERRVGTAPNGDDDGNPVPELVAVTEVQYATGKVRDRVARVVRRDGSGRLLAEMRHYYDGLALGQADAGLLTRQEEVAFTVAQASAIYGSATPDWATLGYHQVPNADGVPSLAVFTTRYAHTAQGMIREKLDALGAKTAFEYDSDGLLVTKLTNAVGHTRTATYDPGWQLIEEHTAPDGTATRYTYDGLGRLTAVIRPGDSFELPTLRYSYDHSTLPASSRVDRRRAAGVTDVYTQVTYFDGQGRELQVRSVLDGDEVRVSGETRTNHRGDPVFKGFPSRATGLAYQAVVSALGFGYTYDSAGRVTEAVNAAGSTAAVSYTPWTSTHVDVLGAVRIEHVDVFGRLEKVTAGGHTATYQHDLLGRLLATTDLMGRPALRAATYDWRGARLRIDHAAAGVRTALYDARRRLVSYADARGVAVTRDFDAIGRLKTESVGGTVQETYTYHDVTGRLDRVDDNAGRVTFGYDNRGRVTSKRRSILGKQYDLSYGYDSSDLQASIGLPDGSTVSYARWGDGRVRSASGFVTQLDYDDFGRPHELTHANGVRETFAYDVTGSLAAATVQHGTTMLFEASLSHDAAGRLTAFQETVTGRAESYTHDLFGRLSQVDNGTDVWHYEHDADGNLLRADEMEAPEFHYDFSKPGALTGRKRADATVEDFTFDAAGQLTGSDSGTYEYDARGRLVRVVKPDGTAVDMIYDYRGARVAKAVTRPGSGVALTRYLDELYEDFNGIGTGYVFLAGRLVGRTRGTGRRHLHVDHRGSVVLVTDSAGGLDGRGWFHPFGRAETLAAPGESRQFTGAVLDPETGLYYFNLRFYSPDLGRFLTPDPRYLAQPERELNLPEAHNLYAYAGGDPVDYTDPTGQGFWETFGKVLAAIVVVVAVIVAVAVVIWLISTVGWAILAAAAVGALIGGIAGGWEGAAMGAMMGATIGINTAIGGPLGIITFLGVFPGIRKADWYHSLAGWSSWLMPASWPGHIMGLGVFLGNGIAHLFGSDKQIESMKFDWKHGQIMTAGGEYGGDPFPWFKSGGPSHSLGGFAFFSNDTWAEGNKSWKGIEDTVDPGRGYAHETGHMLSNAQFGFWQGVVNGIENLTTENHDDRFFEKIAQSNVPAADRDPGDQVIPFWT